MSDSISSTLGSILFTASRSLGGVIPDIVIREQGMDELEITQHPIETGAAITDHAFKRPATLSLEYGFTNANLSNSLASALATGTAPNITLGNQRVRQIYEQLLALQLSRVPFQVVTGKRLYTSMLLEGLGIMTDAATENALLVTATCREIIIVSTQATTVAPQAQQAIPASTAGVTDTGTVQPVVVQNQSLLSSLFGT